MADRIMKPLPFTRFSMEMRSGKIIEIDEGFTKMLGYSEEDVRNGLVFKELVPDVEYADIISELREKFIEQRYACYKHTFKAKDGGIVTTVSFFRVENKLLDGHRVLRVSVGDIDDIN